MEPFNKSEIGCRFALFLETTGQKQNTLARMLSTSQRTVSNIKRGRCLPDSRFLTALAREFGVNVNWLLFQQGEMFKDSDLEKEARFREQYPELSSLLEIPDVATVIFGKLIESKRLLRDEIKFYRVVNPRSMS